MSYSNIKVSMHEKNNLNALKQMKTTANDVGSY